ncbi:MAG: hypothetical protein HQL37_08190 [Alphaproteobacteria bacterium]|nr:hypothetical protein [Alphaproteobacteria bacterium]
MLITIMIVAMATMMLVGVLINQFLVAEARDVEQLLADSRFYWAMDGHAAYLLSEAAVTDAICGTNTTCAADTNRETSLNNLSAKNPLNWSYSISNINSTINPTSCTNDNKCFQTTVSKLTADTSDTKGGITSASGGSLYAQFKTTFASNYGSLFWQNIFDLGNNGWQSLNSTIHPLNVYFRIGIAADPSFSSCPSTSTECGLNYITKVTRPTS